MDFEKRNRSTVKEVEKLRIMVVEKCEIGNLDFVIERKSRKIMYRENAILNFDTSLGNLY